MVSNAICGSLALLPLVGALILIAQAAPLFGSSFDLYEGGFVQRIPDKTISAEWKDVETIWYDRHAVKVEFVPMLLRYKVKVRLQDGREFVIPRPIANIQDLGEWIMTRSMREMLPKAMERIERGEQLEFGDFKVSRDELVVKDKHISWDNQPQIVLNQDRVVLNVKGEALKNFAALLGSGVAMSKIPNLYLLIQLISQLPAACTA